MNIVVIGMGYVGIPTAALFANVDNFNVIGIQRRSKRSGWKIDYLNKGKSPIEGDEPGLSELIEAVVFKGKFHVTDDYSVIRNADVIIITVQTPVDENHIPLYDSLNEVSQIIGKYIKKGAMVCLESTVAPGTTQNIVKPTLEENSGLIAGKDFNLVFSYERVMVGRLIYNLKKMPKIVGGLTPLCAKRAVEFYDKIVDAEIYATDCLTAEVSKVTENSYRDVNIAFANEVALFCESLGINVYDVRKFVNSLPFDPSNPSKNPHRNMHIPGAGVGGHCLPKDPWLLKYGVDTYGKYPIDSQVIVGSRNVNDYMPKHMNSLITSALIEKELSLGEAKICILGYAFLNDSDDTRNTPALPLYNMLESKCRELVVHDPYVKSENGVNISTNLYASLKDADCIVIVTGHNEYHNLSLKELKKIMKTPIIVDGRNIFNKMDCIYEGFTYRGVGIG